MTAMERIAVLEARIAQLEARLAIVEARSYVMPPHQPSYPWAWPNNLPVITCGAGGHQQ